MHTLHGSTASVSAASTTSGASGPSTTKKKQRYSSRSNSLSSASVVTVQRTGSRSSSSTGLRISAGQGRAQSPSDSTSTPRLVGRDSNTQEHKRRTSAVVEEAEQITNGEGLGNLHRWSQSTNSSVMSSGHARHRASSGAALPSLPTQPFSPHKKTRSIVDHSPRPSPQRHRTSSRPSSRRRLSPTTSPERQRRPSRPELAIPLTALPPLHTTPSLTDPNDTESPSTIPTVATPSTQSSYGHDYFGEDGISPRTKGKSKKPVMIRNHTASMAIGNSTRLQAVAGAPDSSTESRGMDDQEDGLKTATLKSRYSEQIPEHDSVRPSTGGEGSGHRRTRTGERGEREKKAMLSKALQKANTAVLLDNAQNFEGALDAYSDACRLLQQVMDRSSGPEDKRKLDSIRVTYTNRIEELRQLDAAQPEASNEKRLPTRPMSDASLPLSPSSARSPTIDSHLGSPVVETATTAHVVDVSKLPNARKDRDSFFSGTIRAVEAPPVVYPEPITIEAPPEELQEQSLDQEESPVITRTDPPTALVKPTTIGERKSTSIPPLNVDGLHIPPSNSRYMPAPLSPRRPSAPEIAPVPVERPAEVPRIPDEKSSVDQPAIEDGNASGSWLDPIDESDSSCASSVHSMSSQQGLHRKHLRNGSGDTNPDFDAAFDAAVEAAYDEGLEPDLEGTRKVEPARSRHAAKDSIIVPSSDIKEILSPTNTYHPGSSLDLDLDLDEEEEERLLDEITHDYAQSFNFDLSTKSALPRQSDSSGYSRSTWQSSQVSDRTTAGTSLSTVAEDAAPTAGSKNAFAASASLNPVLSEPPSAPPPQGSLPKLPPANQNRASGVRSRRLSGQNAKQLKIETTTTKVEPRSRTSTFHHSASPFKEEDEQQSDDLNRDFKFGSDLQPTESKTSEQQHEHILTSPPSLDMLSIVSGVSRPMTATTITTEQRNSLDEAPDELHALRPTFGKKNKSSVSLREHTVILASPVEPPSAITPPMSALTMSFASKRHNEAPISTQRATLPAFSPMASESLPAGAYLFDTSLAASQLPSSPRSPRSPGSQPVGLEPCPESFLLRPFWLMRAIASTLTHSKGGFLTTRLFVPREVWQTKGVKLKAVEEKVANCDLLTAALGRLAGVDTYDADALMEELQNFEEVMERVQAALVKKLGSDVGVGGLAGLFKDAAAVAPSAPGSNTIPEATTSGAEKTKSKESKSYLTSWRKLRSKSSGTPITGSHTNRMLNKTAEKDLPTMHSVPMTSYVPVERRGQKKDARSLTFDGPNREYMGSLARLFEAAQILDQIARQVEDPGLKGSSPTHVGLELSIRHAAEFFGFYVCRFVLADLGTLIDKFVKRGTEWVLA